MGRRFVLGWVALALGTVLPAVLPSPTIGAVTVGQIAPIGEAFPDCSDAFKFDQLNPQVISRNSYVVPAYAGIGAITSWSHNAASGAGQSLVLKVFRKVGDPNVFEVVGHDGPRPMIPNTVNQVAGLHLSVRPGDVVGLGEGTGETACLFTAAGPYLAREGDLSDGEAGSFTEFEGLHVNVLATVSPDEDFAARRGIRNKTSGDVELVITVPNPGTLTVSKKGIRARWPGGHARTAFSVGRGPNAFLLRAAGRKRVQLKRTGRARLTMTLTYTPAFGEPSTRQVSVVAKRVRQR